MQRANPGRAILAGFVGTLVMTTLIYLAPRMGMPKMDIAALLGSVLQGGQEPMVQSRLWWIGMLLHFMMGTILFSLLYAYLVYGLLQGREWVRGLLWGVVLWFLMMALVMPMMGRGFFAANMPQPALFVMGTLLGHLLYGAILGAMAGPQAQRVAQAQDGYLGHNRPV